MSKLYVQYNVMTVTMDASYGGGGGSRTRTQTLGPGGGSDPGNSRTNRTDEGGLRYMTDEDRGNLQRNVAATLVGGAVGGAGSKLASAAGGFALSVVNNNTH